MSGQMTVRLPDGTVARRSRDIPTPLYDATLQLRSRPASCGWWDSARTRARCPSRRRKTPQTPPPGRSQPARAPAVPPAGEGAGKLALPGAEDDEQDAQEPPQEELPLEPLPEPVDEGRAGDEVPRERVRGDADAPAAAQPHPAEPGPGLGPQSPSPSAGRCPPVLATFKVRARFDASRVAGAAAGIAPTGDRPRPRAAKTSRTLARNWSALESGERTDRLRRASPIPR